MEEAAVRERFDVVAESDPRPLARQLKLAEGQKRALKERVKEPDAEGGKGGQQKQPHHSLNGAADQSAVVCG